MISHFVLGDFAASVGSDRVSGVFDLGLCSISQSILFYCANKKLTRELANNEVNVALT